MVKKKKYDSPQVYTKDDVIGRGAIRYAERKQSAHNVNMKVERGAEVSSNLRRAADAKFPDRAQDYAAKSSNIERSANVERLSAQASVEQSRATPKRAGEKPQDYQKRIGKTKDELSKRIERRSARESSGTVWGKTVSKIEQGLRGREMAAEAKKRSEGAPVTPKGISAKFERGIIGAENAAGKVATRASAFSSKHPEVKAVASRAVGLAKAHPVVSAAVGASALAIGAGSMLKKRAQRKRQITAMEYFSGGDVWANPDDVVAGKEFKAFHNPKTFV